MLKLIVAIVIGAIVMISVLGKIESSASSDTDTSETSSSSSNTITVSITGEVNKTGTYYINNGGTLSDLITAAGGATSNADERAYNLDYILKANQSFYIAPIYNTTDTCAQTPITKVNINTADSDELLTINGVKSNIATNIISYRTTNGSFKRIEDLKEVSYVGSATFEKMKNYVILK